MPPLTRARTSGWSCASVTAKSPVVTARMADTNCMLTGEAAPSEARIGMPPTVSGPFTSSSVTLAMLPVPRPRTPMASKRSAVSAVRGTGGAAAKGRGSAMARSAASSALASVVARPCACTWR